MVLASIVGGGGFVDGLIFVGALPGALLAMLAFVLMARDAGPRGRLILGLLTVAGTLAGAVAAAGGVNVHTNAVLLALWVLLVGGIGVIIALIGAFQVLTKR